MPDRAAVVAAVQTALDVVSQLPPDAPPPVPPTVPTIAARQLNLSRVLCPTFQYATDRYERFQNRVVIKTATLAVPFGVTNIAAGGSTAGLSLSHAAYGISVGGVEWSNRYARVGAERVGTVTLTPPVSAADDWYLGALICYDTAGQPIASPTDSATLFWIGLNRSGNLPACADIVKMLGSYAWVHPEVATPTLVAQPGVLAWARMPKANNQPVAIPLAARTAVPFATKVAAAALTRANVVPGMDQDHSEYYRSAYDDDGVTLTNNLQRYFPEDWQLPLPRLTDTDGERNQAAIGPCTDVLLRHGGSFDASTAWRRVHVKSNGQIRTMFGLRHKRARYSGHDSAPNWYDAPDFSDPNLEIVGESGWPASVPRNQRFPWESWAFAFDKRTLAIDPARPKILINGVLTPQHATNVTGFFPDRFNRVVRVQWKSNADGFNVDAAGNVTDPATGLPVDIMSLPPTFAIWISGLPDPWGLVCEDGVIAVTVRGNHRLSEYSADTPETLLRHIIDNPNGSRFGAVGTRRRFSVSAANDSWTAANATAARVDVMVAGEGLATYLDSAADRWYVWGSYAQGEVREINARTKQWRVKCRPFVGYGAKSWFIYVRISDGTFGAAGVVGTTTFSEAATSAGGFGRPELFWPTPGAAADGTPLTNSVAWTWAAATLAKLTCGPGGRTEAAGYAMAFDFGVDGRLVASSSLGGLDEWTLAAAGAPLPDEAKMARGFAYWKSKHYELFWGSFGFDGPRPLPFGENVDCDYWLHWHGH